MLKNEILKLTSFWQWSVASRILFNSDHQHFLIDLLIWLLNNFLRGEKWNEQEMTLV